ncbi:uncharacterized protein LOC118181009 [Stegodyphus dumicola]|uniref:uncharacterized protein LOC118181009 n=1 Tax=Stegodyphus dumicola TaxID=202533 RepID=UPI0015AEB0A1|nr:uncharacterized protein LOC118181009 [Stegodyphus dumicola]
MEEMDRGKEEGVDSQRSSSTFDLPQQKTSEQENGDLPKPIQRKLGPRMGNLMGQHAAITKELEMKLKCGMAPGVRRIPSEDEEDQSKEEMETGKKIEYLSAKVDLAKDTLNVLEERVSLLTTRVEATSEKSDKTTSQVGDLLLQVTVTLKEAERINAECKRALEEANKARTEYQLLVKECKETLVKLNGEQESENGT